MVGMIIVGVLLLGTLGTTIYFAIRLSQQSSWTAYADRVATATDEQLWTQAGCNQPFASNLLPNGSIPEKRLFIQDLWHRELTEKKTSYCYSS